MVSEVDSLQDGRIARYWRIGVLQDGSVVMHWRIKNIRTVISHARRSGEVGGFCSGCVKLGRHR